MPRQRDVAAKPAPTPTQLSPLAASGGIETALEALVVWANSATLRSGLMQATDFPWPDDQLAFLLLNQLVYRGAARPSAMAEAIQTSTSNVAKVVRRLEDAGLVERAPDPTDNRAIVIALTAAGRDAGTRILSHVRALFEVALADWSDSDRHDFARLAVRLAASLDAATSSSVSAVSGIPLRGGDAPPLSRA